MKVIDFACVEREEASRRCQLRAQLSMARQGRVSMLRSVIAAIAITITGAEYRSRLRVPQALARKAILVTGASTGIGRKLTEQLAADGYFIYATARKDADLQALATIKNVSKACGST